MQQGIPVLGGLRSDGGARTGAGQFADAGFARDASGVPRLTADWPRQLARDLVRSLDICGVAPHIPVIIISALPAVTSLRLVVPLAAGVMGVTGSFKEAGAIFMTLVPEHGSLAAACIDSCTPALDDTCPTVDSQGGPNENCRLSCGCVLYVPVVAVGAPPGGCLALEFLCSHFSAIYAAIVQIAALARALAAALPEVGFLGPYRATMLLALLGAAPGRALADPLHPALFNGRAAGAGGFPGTRAIPALGAREEASFRASLHPPPMPGGAALGGPAALRIPAQLPPPTFAHPGVFRTPASASFGPSLEAMMAASRGDGSGGGGGGGGSAGAGSQFGDALTEAALLQQQMLPGSLPYGAATGGSAAGFAAPRRSGGM